MFLGKGGDDEKCTPYSNTEREGPMYKDIQRQVASCAHSAARARKATSSILSCSNIRKNYCKTDIKKFNVLGVHSICVMTSKNLESPDSLN
jgi:hypothetical protein